MSIWNQRGIVPRYQPETCNLGLVIDQLMRANPPGSTLSCRHPSLCPSNPHRVNFEPAWAEPSQVTSKKKIIQSCAANLVTALLI